MLISYVTKEVKTAAKIEKKKKGKNESLLKDGNPKYVTKYNSCRKNHKTSCGKYVRIFPRGKALFVLLTRFSLTKRKKIKIVSKI